MVLTICVVVLTPWLLMGQCGFSPIFAHPAIAVLAAVSAGVVVVMVVVAVVAATAAMLVRSRACARPRACACVCVLARARVCVCVLAGGSARGGRVATPPLCMSKKGKN